MINFGKHGHFSYFENLAIKRSMCKKNYLNQFDDEESEFVVGFFKFGKIFLLRRQIWRFLKKITLKANYMH